MISSYLWSFSRFLPLSQLYVLQIIILICLICSVCHHSSLVLFSFSSFSSCYCCFPLRLHSGGLRAKGMEKFSLGCLKFAQPLVSGTSPHLHGVYQTWWTSSCPSQAVFQLATLVLSKPTLHPLGERWPILNMTWLSWPRSQAVRHHPPML